MLLEKLAHSHVLSGEGRLRLGVGLEELGLPRHLSFSLWSFSACRLPGNWSCMFVQAHVSSLQEAGQAVLPSVISL